MSRRFNFPLGANVDMTVTKGADSVQRQVASWRNPGGGMGPPPPDPPPSGGTVTQAMIDFRAAFIGQAESNHNMMALDENMRREMVLAVQGLAPRALCTHVAVQNGNWTTATTWLNASNEFEVPTAGARVGVPAGITVTYDADSTAEYQSLRIDGTFQFATDRNTRLEIDTIVGEHSSTWRQGTVATPIPAQFTSIVEFPDGGDINTQVDTLLLGRGIILMGDVEIHGAAKQWMCKASQTRAIGDSTILLDEDPVGWQVGDEITVGGVTAAGWVGPWNGVTSPSYVAPRCQHTTISAISGRTITLADPLVHTRDVSVYRADPAFADTAYFIGNYSRNVKFRSPPGTPIHRRGHSMFMHSGVDVRYAEATLLGRTRKDIESVDATNDARMDLIYGPAPRPATANVRGRYNWHIHRAGTGTGKPYALLHGCAASDSPGWVYSHHSSYANFTECNARRFLGVGFMAEVGDEVGSWTRCLAQDGVNPNAPGGQNEEKSLANLNIGDFGKFGSAFWGRSRVVQLHDVYASDCDSAMVWMSREGTTGLKITDPKVDDQPFPIKYYQSGTLSGADQAILIVDGARSIGCGIGMIIIKAQPDQKHSFRSRFFNMRFVACRNGISLNYTGKYSYRDVGIWRTASGSNSVRLSQSTVDMVFQNLTTRVGPGVTSTGQNGAGVAVDSGSNATSGAEWTNTFVNYDAGETDPFNYSNRSNASFPVTPQDYIDRTIQLQTSDIQVRPLTWVPAAEPFWNGAVSDRYELEGTLTDSIRIKDRTFGPGNFNGIWTVIEGRHLGGLLGAYGYFTYNGANYVLVPDAIFDPLLDANGDFIFRYLTLPLRFAGYTIPAGATNRGALPQRYVDAILTGQGSPTNGAAPWVVYEDALGPGGIHEGL